MTLVSSPHQRSPFSLLDSYYHNTQCRYCLTHICGQVNLCSQCHYSLHYLQVSCSTGQHQRRHPALYTHNVTLYPAIIVRGLPFSEYELEACTSGAV